MNQRDHPTRTSLPRSATVSECSVTRGESRVQASLDPMTPASLHDDADAEISMALQLSSSITLTLDSFTTSPLNIQASITFTDYLPLFTGCVQSCRIFDHPQIGVVYNFGRVCLSVCLYVCLSDDNFHR